MPAKITEAWHTGDLISVAQALEIRGKEKTVSGMFDCPECRNPVKPMKAGGASPEHFEHFERNPTCSLSHVDRKK